MPGGSFDRVVLSVSPPAVVSVPSQLRTACVELCAELYGHDPRDAT